MPPADLADLSRGFRERHLDYAELTAQLRAWCEAFPDLARLQSIGRSGEGRELWLLTVGPEPERVRPAVWVDGNMHASELAGSSVALAIAEDALRLHLEDAPPHDLPGHLGDVLRGVLFYVLPRMSPDGAEAVLKTGRYLRSVPRDERVACNAPRWQAHDLDGDGLALAMRRQDPAGEYVESAALPGVMVPREVEDPGPYYRIYPEGTIEGFDGVNIPEPGFMSDNPVDLNRNFPWDWQPPREQRGAGEFPTSEPESRAVVAFTSRAPHIFAWLNLHTFGGVFIRPLGHKPDAEMERSDLALFRQLEAWGDDLVGYPMVSGCEEFTYQPDTPLHGDLADYAYHQRGCIAYVCELWDLFARVGLPRPKRFVDHYSRLGRADVEAVARFDAEHNGRRSFPPWRPLEHPQLGPVEVGGLDPRQGIWNPPPERLPELCTGQGAMYLRVAALAPRLTLTLSTEDLGGGLTRVAAEVENLGYLPTHVLESARGLDWNEPVYAGIEPEGCTLRAPDEPRREVGHLAGWGRGLYDGSANPAFQRSRGSGHRRRVSWVVQGPGRVTVRAGACRVGWVSAHQEVP